MTNRLVSSTLKLIVMVCLGVAEIHAATPEARANIESGVAHFLKFDYDHAFADYEAAIQSDPQEPDAYRWRGVIFQIRGEDDRAIADFTRALELGAKDSRILIDRGSAYVAAGDARRAIADYTASIQQDPNSPFGYLLRGVAYTYTDELEKAQADFKRGFEVDPKIPYFKIWLHIADRRAKKPGSLSSAAPKLDMTKWPAQVVRMFIGEETPANVLARGEANVKLKKYGDCESTFFVAEYMYLQNNRARAVRLYKDAQEKCRRNFVEWTAATLALGSLNESLSIAR